MKTLIGNIIAIYRKEVQSYFASPFAYVIAGVFWLLSGIIFWVLLLSPQGLIAQAGFRDQVGVTDPPIDVPYQFLSIFLELMSSWFSLFFLPMLSMGLYADERKRGTLELLATSPITNWAVALGKLLGALTFFVTMLLPIMGYEAIALTPSDPPIQPTVFFLAHGALILLAAAILSMGMFISSLTESTILAAFLTFGLILLLWLIGPIGSIIGGPIGQAFEHLSLLQQFDTLSQGVLDTSSLILFGSYIVLGLFLTAQSIEALRFQRS